MSLNSWSEITHHLESNRCLICIASIRSVEIHAGSCFCFACIHTYMYIYTRIYITYFHSYIYIYKIFISLYKVPVLNLPSTDTRIQQLF